MSSREMTINQIKSVDKDFGANHTIKISGFKDKKGNSKTDLILEKIDQINTRLDKHDEMFSLIFKKLDKIEEFDKYVLDQFKQHGWTK